MIESKPSTPINAPASEIPRAFEVTVDERLKYAQIAKIEIETRLLGTPWWRQFDTQAKIALAVIGVAGGVLALYLQIPQLTLQQIKVTEELNKKKKELEDAKRDVKVVQDEAELRLQRVKSEVANLQQEGKIAQMNAAPSQKAAFDPVVKPRVFIQFAGDLKRELVKEYVSVLKNSNFAVPEPERITGPSRTEVRYFLPADAGAVEQSKLKQQADQVLTSVKDFFAQKGCPLEEPRIQWIKNAPSPLELWINHNCKL
jgi:hypothetical protein